MALVKKIEKTVGPVESLALAFRVLPRTIDTGILNKSGTKTKKRKLDAFEVFNEHLNVLDVQCSKCEGDFEKTSSSFVYYSSDVLIDCGKAKNIDEIVFFSYTERWAARCRVKVLTNVDAMPFIPEDVNENNSVEFWRSIACPTWIKIYDYLQMDFEELNDIEVVNPNKSGSRYLGELLCKSKRFSRTYIKK